MKTLDRTKSEELFNRLIDIKVNIQHMAGAVQNPDFVNEDNVVHNYERFKYEYYHVISMLSDIHDEMFALHSRVKNN